MKIDTEIQSKWGRYKATPIYGNLDTLFGVVTLLDRNNGKVQVRIDDDITATFREKEFVEEFVI